MFGTKSMGKILMLTKGFPSYTRGTIDFLRRLNSMCSLPNNSIVFNVNIETLYKETIKNMIADLYRAHLGLNCATLCSPITISFLAMTNAYKSLVYLWIHHASTICQHL